MPRVFADEHLDPVVQRIALAAVLVAQRHQAERRMVAVGADDAQEFLLHELADRRVAVDMDVRLRPFDLEIDALDVGGGEGGLRRAPGVEPHEVQPVGFQNAEDPLPAPARRWADSR